MHIQICKQTTYSWPGTKGLFLRFFLNCTLLVIKISVALCLRGEQTYSMWYQNSSWRSAKFSYASLPFFSNCILLVIKISVATSEESRPFLCGPRITAGEALSLVTHLCIYKYLPFFLNCLLLVLKIYFFPAQPNFQQAFQSVFLLA